MPCEVGAIVEGKVTGLTDFGAFVELEGGGTGMVHISEVSASYVKNIRDHLKEGQTVKVKIISIDDNGRINLSIKKAASVQDSAQRPHPAKPQSQRRPSAPANVWQGQKPVATQGQSFEEMMARFKQVSDEKITDLKRSGDPRHSGYSRRGSGGR
ncbi:MAG: S1 RNA-binding domain-containing protein [Clostridia bacterium]|nr:S1 RNA-binding domain-containing protein [Clostridia bacterium]